MMYKVVVPEARIQERYRTFILKAENVDHALQIVDENYSALASSVGAYETISERYDMGNASTWEVTE